MFKTTCMILAALTICTAALAEGTWSSAGAGNNGQLTAAGGFSGGEGFVNARTLGWAGFARSSVVNYGPNGLNVSFSYGYDRGDGATARHFALGVSGGQSFHNQSLMRVDGPWLRHAEAGGQVDRCGGCLRGNAWGTGYAAPYGYVSGSSFSQQSPGWLP
jgi:hypothetical protein